MWKELVKTIIEIVSIVIYVLLCSFLIALGLNKDEVIEEIKRRKGIK